MPRRTSALLTLLAMLLLALPGSAAADRRAEVSIMDDQLLLNAGSRAQVDTEIAGFKALGADRLRVSAFWDQIAPAPLGRSKPAFDATDPASPAYNFAALDRVVSSAAAHGLAVMVSITTPAPLWATADPSRGNNVWKPSPREFAAFAQAVTRRYAPLVDRWAISNEPNQQQWLQPQSENGKAFAPHHYRRMVRASYPRIKAADPASLVLIGELASVGSTAVGARRGVKPLRFLRTMACRDRRYRRMRSGPCRRFEAIPGDAIGHHPYQFTAPTVRSFHRDDAAIGDGLKILRVVDAIRRRGGLSGPRRMNLYYTEFGYQTNPPDPFAGVSLSRQSRYLQRAAYIVWRTRRIREINQFRLTDGQVDRGAGRRGFIEFQSGLLFADRRPKPSLRAFRSPFVVSGSRFWGQVRGGTGPYTVRVQRRIGRRRWDTVLQLLVRNRRGYFSRRLPGRRAGTYRYLYDGPGVRGTSPSLRIR
jgi:hypothetical protein